MELEIGKHDVHLNDTLRDHIERRLDFALSQFGNFVSRVTVTLADVNGPRGGPDKQCRLLIHLRSGSLVKVEDTDEDMTAAVNRAADRAGHAVARQLERIREKKAS